TIVALILTAIISLNFIRALDLALLLHPLRLFMLPDWLQLGHGLLLLFPLALLLLLIFHPARKRWFVLMLAALSISVFAEGGMQLYITKQLCSGQC
ncbi:MAG: hypothetical protein Q9M09_04310, partial [Mariprofundaceae bacterium]|nr:hypothetical protein [Mariprofundaceae bacterium]